MVLAMTLEREFDGVYEFVKNNYHPIDDVLFGNDGDDNNHYFTYEVAAEFTYEGCAGQFVDFRGTDDFWLFIDCNLVMDLGGVGANTLQYLDLDRLGLSDGETYRLKLFYAQRQSSQAVFRLRTNLVLTPLLVLPTISASFD